MRTRIASVALVAIAMTAQTLPTAAGSPSFDCETVKSDVERLICGDDELADLDVKVARAFANHIAKAPANEVTALKGSQVEWRKSLLACGKSGDARSCTLDRYQSRLSEL